MGHRKGRPAIQMTTTPAFEGWIEIPNDWQDGDSSWDKIRVWGESEKVCISISGAKSLDRSGCEFV